MPEAAVPAEFTRECASFFAARLQGPPDARGAVLLALQRGEPYPLAWTACLEAEGRGRSRSRSRRVGLVAEVLRAALEVCAEIYRQVPLRTRLERARRVLVADTLLTFCYELAAEIPRPEGDTVRGLLADLFGPHGFLEELTSGSAAGLDPREAARKLLERSLGRMPTSQRPRSPRITNVSWSRLDVEGRDRPYKDAKVFPGGSREWDWNETGTRHVPGIQPADVEELLERGSTVVVLSRGMDEQLQICPETLRMLKDRGILAHVRQTEEAVRLFNQLREKESVGGLFHSTC